MNAPGKPTMTTFLLARYGPSAIFSGGKFSREVMFNKQLGHSEQSM